VPLHKVNVSSATRKYAFDCKANEAQRKSERKNYKKRKKQSKWQIWDAIFEEKEKKNSQRKNWKKLEKENQKRHKLNISSHSSQRPKSAESSICAPPLVVPLFTWPPQSMDAGTSKTLCFDPREADANRPSRLPHRRSASDSPLASGASCASRLSLQSKK
jgi:hypothetical protein